MERMPFPARRIFRHIQERPSKLTTARRPWIGCLPSSPLSEWSLVIATRTCRIGQVAEESHLRGATMALPQITFAAQEPRPELGISRLHSLPAAARTMFGSQTFAKGKLC